MRALAAFIAALFLQSAAMAADLTIFAAASLTDVMTRIGEEFGEQTGARVAISFAGSSVLARQIERGAPADVMISANRRWIDYLESGGHLAARSRRVIAGNRLVLIARSDDSLQSLDPAHIDLATDDRIAVGDPGHVPVGIYARQALEATGQWEKLSSQLIPAASTRAAVAFVQRGAVRFGIAYRSDALAFPGIRELAAFPTDAHDPIRYEAAATRRGSERNRETALAFLSFLTSHEAGNVFRAFGLRPCLDGDC